MSSSEDKARIPPWLIDTHRQYKRDTEIIVAWLIRHGGTAKQKNRRTITMKELLGMSEVICSQKSSVLLTDDLRMAFRHAIDARTQITNHFCRMPGHHGDEMADVTHAFFTSTLQQIYADLRKACAKPKSSKPAEPVSASAHVEKETLSGFAKLKIERGKKKVPSTEDRQSPDVKHSLNDGQAVDDGQQADDGQCLDDHNHAEPVDSKETKRPPRLADDGLAEAFELCKEVQDMCDHIEAADNIARYSALSKGEIPLPLTGFLLNAVTAGFQRSIHRLESLCGGSSPELLKTNISKLNLNPESANDGKAPSHTAVQDQMSVFEQIWQSLTNFKSKFRSQQHQEVAYKPQDPTKVLFQQTWTSLEFHQESFELMLQSIGYQMGKYRALSAYNIAPDCYPTLSTLDTFLGRKKNNSGGLLCCAELHLFYKTYETYNTSLKILDERPQNLVKAFRFAKEAVASIDHVLESGTIGGMSRGEIGPHLRGLKKRFMRFLNEPNLTIYMHSPWVSGSWILDGLDSLFNYGVRLLSSKHYVGSILHVYHILKIYTDFEVRSSSFSDLATSFMFRLTPKLDTWKNAAEQKADLEFDEQEIPLLEQLCEVFPGIFFPGGPPSQGFEPCFLRFCGYRTTTSKCGHHHNGCFHWTLPATTSVPDDELVDTLLHAEANISRFDVRQMSVLHYLKAREYVVDDTVWKYLNEVSEDVDWSHLTDKLGEDTSKWTTTEALDRLGVPPVTGRFIRLSLAITMTDFRGPFPYGKMNFFEIYVACARIMALICKKKHCDESPEDGYCLCYAFDLLQAADRVKSGEQKLFGNQKLVDECKKAMRDVLADRKLEEFLWQGI